MEIIVCRHTLLRIRYEYETPQQDKGDLEDVNSDSAPSSRSVTAAGIIPFTRHYNRP